MDVSVIIPAFNAATTLRETLDSLRAQTFTRWEAILVDDGSTDGTAALAHELAALDERIRLVEGEHQGVSAARNTGLRHAWGEWALFLDADDLLLPHHLERLMAAVEADPGLDAVYSGWARLTPDGRRIDEDCLYISGDLFPTLARFSAFPIHACLARKALVEDAGGWDPTYIACEDWDLWQRIARMGARFGVVQDVLALYRMSANSASLDGFQMLTDGLRVLDNGHSPDGRVANPLPAYRDGLPAEDLLDQKLHFLAWCAGLAIGQGRDPRVMLDRLEGLTRIHPDPQEIGDSLFRTIPLSRCLGYESWSEIWNEMEQPIQAFLEALEATPELQQGYGFERRVFTHLEALILDHADSPEPKDIGRTRGLILDIEAPIPDLPIPTPVERLYCALLLQGSRIGSVELPVFDGSVPGYVLADAIADEWAWEILKRYFRANIYSEFELREAGERVEVWRGEVCLTAELPQGEDSLRENLHDLAGWTLFLQELWGKPDQPLDWFYDPQVVEAGAPSRQDEAGWLSVDVGEALPDVECTGEELRLRFSVGGAAIGVVTLPVEGGRVTAHALRIALTRAGGFELCRAAVREGLLGKLFQGAGSLHARLAESLAHSRQPATFPKASLSKPESVELAEGWQATLRRALPPGGCGAIIPRRVQAEIDTPLSRRAAFPASVYTELVQAAEVQSEPLLHVNTTEGQPVPTVYAPDLLYRMSGEAGGAGSPCAGTPAEPDRKYTRSVFEGLFAAQQDPWQYAHPYEQIKYEQTLGLLPDHSFGEALELGCAEGHFTLQLAPHVRRLVAADISRVALERASQRCAGLSNVRFVTLDIAHDPLPVLRGDLVGGRFDLIVCSEVLYYVGDREALKTTAQKLVDALKPGGYLLMAHARLVVDEPDRPGFNWDHPFGAQAIGETFEAIENLHLAKALETPLYHIQLFRRKPRFSLFDRQELPQVTRLTEPPAPPPPGADVQVLWQGGSPMPYEPEPDTVTERLPILMYHRVAPGGSLELAPYRITPEMFEDQLRYLRESRYYSICLEDWQAAIQEHKALPGRAVLITFDDGYKDFIEYAGPLLRQYGFTATVFLVADEIGGTNRWDHRFGEQIPLLGWDEIRQLTSQGIRFGSHSASHPLLTEVSPVEVVRQALRSRRIIQAGLEQPVRAFAYPHGAENRLIRHILGACGYLFGLTTQPARSSLWDPLLALPRLDVNGADSFEEFVSKLSNG